MFKWWESVKKNINVIVNYNLHPRRTIIFDKKYIIIHSVLVGAKFVPKLENSTEHD